jgi:cobalt-zinc-cadmium efflux system outer membrane protein
MRSVLLPALAIAGAALSAGGCASTRVDDASEINEVVASRGAPAAHWPARKTPWSPEADARLIAEKTRAPLSARGAVEIAFLRSPAIREAYADLGIAQAEIIEALAVPNPTFEYSRLDADEGGAQITRSLSLSLANLLFLPTRARIAGQNRQIARDGIAARLLQLQGEVEAAWFEHVAARQTAQMRAAAARAAEASGEYARRLHAAGNLSRKDLALELAAASNARITSARASVRAAESRAELAALLGLSTRDAWQVSASLPSLPEVDASVDSLADAADRTRVDLSGARQEVQVLENVLQISRWWRWLGDIEIGYEREREADGARLRGPTFSIGIPIFDFNRAGILRAEADLERARARLTELEIEVRNDVALGLDKLATAREIAEAYRTALVPQREAVTRQTLEELNFMLADAFEALQAKREQYDAYGEYIEAVRDYWLARVELRLALGGALPDDAHAAGAALSLDQPADAPTESHGDHK